MAGRSHWSMSVEPTASGPGFLFDIACRTIARPAYLGSRYRSQVPVVLAADQNSGRWEFSGTRVRAHTIALAQQPPTLLVETAEGFCVEPQFAKPLATPTIRWQYELQLG